MVQVHQGRDNMVLHLDLASLSPYLVALDTWDIAHRPVLAFEDYQTVEDIPVAWPSRGPCRHQEGHYTVRELGAAGVPFVVRHRRLVVEKLLFLRHLLELAKCYLLLVRELQQPGRHAVAAEVGWLDALVDAGQVAAALGGAGRLATKSAAATPPREHGAILTVRQSPPGHSTSISSANALSICSTVGKSTYPKEARTVSRCASLA